MHYIQNKNKVSISFHTMETTDMHLFVANTDTKFHSTLLSANNIL